jgi:hypothetical protein
VPGLQFAAAHHGRREIQIRETAAHSQGVLIDVDLDSCAYYADDAVKINFHGKCRFLCLGCLAMHLCAD